MNPQYMEIKYKSFINDAKSPCWNKARKVHDWRNYVTEDVKMIWDTICLIGRCAIIDCCKEMADNEEWE